MSEETETPPTCDGCKSTTDVVSIRDQGEDHLLCWPCRARALGPELATALARMLARNSAPDAVREAVAVLKKGVLR